MLGYCQTMSVEGLESSTNDLKGLGWKDRLMGWRVSASWSLPNTWVLPSRS